MLPLLLPNILMLIFTWQVLLKQQPSSYGSTPGYGNSYGYTAEYRNPNSEKRIEGDIIVKNDLQGARSPAVFRENIWPDAKIPYVISNEYGILANITVQFLIYSFKNSKMLFRSKWKEDYCERLACISWENMRSIQPSHEWSGFRQYFKGQ